MNKDKTLEVLETIDNYLTLVDQLAITEKRLLDYLKSDAADAIAYAIKQIKEN